jgi:hypothetical protein
MHGFVRSLLVFLMVAALGAATAGAASALPCAGHDRGLMAEGFHAARHASHLDPAACHHHRLAMDGKCACTCCCSAGSLAFAESGNPFVPSSVHIVAFLLPGDQMLAGITVRPVTGPPKLSV